MKLKRLIIILTAFLFSTYLMADEAKLDNNNKIIKKYIGPLNKVSVEEIKLYIK